MSARKIMRLRDLSALAYGAGFTLWHYRTDDFDAVLYPEFWTDAENMLGPGDIIHCTASRGALTLHVGPGLHMTPMLRTEELSHGPASE